jgi:hypothetical protein
MDRRDSLLKVERGTPTFVRVAALPVILIVAAVAGLEMYRWTHSLEGKYGKAKMDLSHLSSAVDAWKAETGSYPDTLQELTQSRDGKVPYLSEKDLLDPWGRPYGYDPNQRHPASGQPKIFCVRDTTLTNW